VARKLPQLQRVLDAPALFSVAYGEIASSIYFALGVIALYALGFTPLVLLAAGLIFVVVALSYAEGTAAIRETGGAATFVRRGFNDLAGFMTGWVLFLDYLIVIALATLSVPHYFGAAFHVEDLRGGPWDYIAGVALIAAIAAVRITRRARLYRFALVVAIVDLATQLLLVGLGMALLFSPDALTRGTDLGSAPSWHEIAFALPLAFLAYTGLETVANLAEETRRPGRDLPRSLFSGVVVVVGIYVAIALVGLSAFPPENGETALAGEWLRAPLMGIVDAVGADIPWWLATPLRVYVGLTAMLVLVAAATTSISGFGRLAYSLGEHGQLPRVFGRLHRRTLVAPQSIVAAAAISAVLLVGASLAPEDTVVALASLFSFGVLLAFTAAQVAVLRLRVTQPALRRPFRVPLSVLVRGADVPVPTVVGVVATFTIWIVALVTHPWARYGGPIWLALGLVLYVAVRRGLKQPLRARVAAADEHQLPEPKYQSILVPMKLGPIGEEMVATAVKLAHESGARIEAIYVIAVPLEQPLHADLVDEEERALASLSEARLLGSDYGVEVDAVFRRARSIGSAIVDEAERRAVDLIVLGSSPRWRRQSRFFSPTVEYVLKRAPCEVLIVAFPQGSLEEGDGAAS
jgi:APA family basic amino acid/polyamine antiporter